MIIYPAIDLKNSKCVRLYKGDMDKATIFNNSPSEQAKYFKNKGFKKLHLVDLDGAIAGKSVNSKSIKEIIDNVDSEIQLGGGIRNMNDVEFWLNLGIKKVIIGTAAIKNPNLVEIAAKKFPGQIIIAIDARDNYVATSGWVDDSKIKVIDLAKQFENMGVSEIIYTDINKDGTLLGPNIESTVELSKKISIPVIVSGGVSSIEDIYRIKKLKEDGIKGVIIGRALYDNKINIDDLVKI